MLYLVSEIFPTIQGEAHWTGTPATFIRLQGCPVGCPWCDTKYTWTTEVDRVSPADLLAKADGVQTAASMTAQELCDAVTAHAPLHVVLTGGEPALQPIGYLAHALQAQAVRVQIETSGCYPIENLSPDAWVTVSPKLDMPGGVGLCPDTLTRADEIKMPIGRERDIEALRKRVLPLAKTDRIWLQPLSLSAAATRLCVEAAGVYGWRVSLQAHKYAGLR
jgi:7-carboxy-7-deazaguanine synthase